MEGKKFQDLTRRMVEIAQQRGATMSEAYVTFAKELSVDVSNQEIETMKTANQHGAGMRVIVGERMGFAYTSDLDPSVLEETVAQALANAEKTTPDKFNTLARPGVKPQTMELCDPEIGSTPIEAKIQLAMEIERQARAYDPRVKITERCGYEDTEYQVFLVNSLGIDNSYKAAYCGAYSFLVAEEGRENQTGFGFRYSQRYADLDPVVIGREGAEKAVRMLGAKTIGTRKAAIVFDPYVATNFLGVLAPALTAEAVQKGKSLFSGKLGQRVAADIVTIVDDGTMPGGLLSSPVDGEGVPTGRTVLIEGGMLKGFLHNTYTASKDGVSSTGNGTRGSYKSTPEVGTTNFYIQPGTISRDKLLGEIEEGLYITEVMGMHTANPISGDFSVGAAGIWIHQGELTTPVRGVAIAGNIIELLESIDGAADDLRFFVGRGAPTVRIARMTISGS
ncbi:MAG: TldD/PmbA family protein [Bacillota bacterium]